LSLRVSGRNKLLFLQWSPCLNIFLPYDQEVASPFSPPPSLLHPTPLPLSFGLQLTPKTLIPLLPLVTELAQKFFPHRNPVGPPPFFCYPPPFHPSASGFEKVFTCPLWGVLTQIQSPYSPYDNQVKFFIALWYKNARETHP